jgi:putative ABC transport system permease protein
MLKLAWRGVRHNTGRYIATLIAIITGVGFFAATGFLGDRVVQSLEGDTRRQFESIDLAITPIEADDEAAGVEFELRLPSTVADEVAAIDGVDATAGILTGAAALRDTDGEVVEESAGRVWVSDADLNPLELADGRGPEAGDEIAVDQGIADDQGLAVGSSTIALTLAGEFDVTVVGITRFGDSDRFEGGTISVHESVGFDWLADGQAEYQAIYARTESGSQTALAAFAEPITPAGFEVQTGDAFVADQVDQFGSIGKILKRALQFFAILALFVGGFVIYNTFSVLVAQRLKELAVLRAIGATPKQVRRALRFEGAVVGLLGSAFGVVTGIGLVYVLDFVLGRFGVELPGQALVISSTVVTQAILLGTSITVLSVMIPARRAARTEPIEALRDAAVESSPYTTKRLIFAGACFIAGVAMLVTGPKGWMIGAGLFFTFVGTIAAGPMIAVGGARVARPLASKLGLEGRLATDNIARNPQRTATTANALLIGVFLVTFVSVAGESAKDWVVDQIQEIESADYLLASTGGTLDDDLLATVNGVDGVETVESFRRETVTLNAAPALVSTANTETLLALTDLEASAGSLDDLEPGTIAAISSSGLDIGDTASLEAATGAEVELTVVALLAEGLDVTQVGALIHQQDFDRLAGDTAPTVAFIDVATGARTETQDQLDEATANRPDLELIDGNALGKLIGSIFDFLINAVNGLLGMSVAVAVIGIINTLTLSIFERRRELGLLRVVGMTDRRVQRMVRVESVLISVLGTLTGVALGLLAGATTIAAINRLFDTSIALNLASGRLILVIVAGVVLGVAASLIPARRSTNLDVLDAIQAS